MNEQRKMENEDVSEFRFERAKAKRRTRTEVPHKTEEKETAEIEALDLSWRARWVVKGVLMEETTVERPNRDGYSTRRRR